MAIDVLTWGGAAFLIAYGTSHVALDYKARMKPGERLLVLDADTLTPLPLDSARRQLEKNFDERDGGFAQ